MNKLPAEARSLLESARKRHVPSECERERIRHALFGTLGADALADPPEASFEPSGDGSSSSSENASHATRGSLSPGGGTAASGKVSVGLATKIASSTLLTWRVGKVVLVGDQKRAPARTTLPQATPAPEA